ncbi:MAG TPA: hypothetical protein VGM64_14730 [Lacunisphaera sp.]|jgi:hypothetical protein
MKLYSLILMIVLPLTMSARDVAIGDSSVQVREAMGAPRGQVHVGGRDLLYFDRGEVELNNGRVSRVGLRSLEEQNTFESKQAEASARTDEARSRLMEEGRVLMASKLSDPIFQATPYSYQISFWENFSHRYPDVSPAEQLLVVRSRLAEQVAKAEADRAQAEQVQRVADLAERAARARYDYVYPFYPVYRDYSYHNNDRGTRHSIENSHDDRPAYSSASRTEQNSSSANGKSMIGPSKLGWDPSINMMDWNATSTQSDTLRSSRR